MNFNEWITQNKGEDFSGLTNNPMELQTAEDRDLVENQLDQWVTRLMGLLQGVPQNRKHKLIERVISELQASINF